MDGLMTGSSCAAQNECLGWGQPRMRQRQVRKGDCRPTLALVAPACRGEGGHKLDAAPQVRSMHSSEAFWAARPGAWGLSLRNDRACP